MIESDEKSGVSRADPQGVDCRSGMSGADLIDDLVIANHILFDQGIVDAYGHVSARHGKRQDRFFMSASMAPAQVTRQSMIEFDLSSEPVEAEPRALYAERFIHGCIYAARPDVQAIVHSHSPSVVPFSVVPGVILRAVCHTCGFLGSGVPTFEMREVAGAQSDLLIRNAALGKALAGALGDAPVVLMRGHGVTTVGTSLQVAVYRAVYTEINARTQALALQLGNVVYLTDEEARLADNATHQHVMRPWNMWRWKIEGKL